jgi:hypothetical protein
VIQGLEERAWHLTGDGAKTTNKDKGNNNKQTAESAETLSGTA